jgi:hypothetical protein
MKKIVFLAALMLLFATTSQAQKTYTETRNLSGFSKIDFALAGEVYITFGNDYSVVLKGDRSYLEDVETRVSGDELIIKRDKWFEYVNEKVIVEITMPSLDGIRISGSGKVIVNDPLRGKEFNMSISGSGKIILKEIALDDVECHISGSGSLYIEGPGTVRELKMSISGSGSLKGEGVNVSRLDARISGSGSCDCNVTDLLKASISGSGSIYYSGNPKIDASISGSGKVRSK